MYLNSLGRLRLSYGGHSWRLNSTEMSKLSVTLSYLLLKIASSESILYVLERIILFETCAEPHDVSVSPNRKDLLALKISFRSLSFKLNSNADPSHQNCQIDRFYEFYYLIPRHMLIIVLTYAMLFK